ncbi:MAG: glycosyl hydrolase family 18 protein [Desulfovibrionaceae bacterium]|nr:glycosyl hydrolase family 18 protein [Desulfovibrionaceae bacterium]
MTTPRRAQFVWIAVAVCVLFSQNTPCAAPLVGGYWENWNPPLDPGSGTAADPSYYANDLEHFNSVYYSFLTLAQTPNPDNPPVAHWDGQAIYESMTAADVITVMTVTDPAWANPYEWQRVKIQALIDACHAQGKKFIWAVGGWSDLTLTVTDEQIPALVDYLVRLLQLSGDGVDFDWEHLSTAPDPDVKNQQRRVLGKIFAALRSALDAAGLSHRQIGYTTRFNAFWDDATRPEGVTAFESDGEGIAVADAATAAGSPLADCLNWINIMMYDVPPTALGAPPTGFTLSTYQMVLDAFARHVPKNLVVMGFEPGGQAAGGVWEGMAVDRQAIDFVLAQKYRGIMFWAINQPALPPSVEVTGLNARELARYALETWAKTVALPYLLLLGAD